MIIIKCPQCGEQLTIDETVATSAKCKVCGREATIEQDAPEQYKKLKSKQSEDEAQYKAITEKYAETGDAKEIHTAVESYKQRISTPDSVRVWRVFVLDAAGVSEARKDKELQAYLKNHAKEFDAEIKPKESLYSSVLQSYPGVGNMNDWEDLIKRTRGDEVKFTVLTENIINYIVKTKNKAFAMEIFHLFEAKGEEWADSGRIYVRTLLGSEEIANTVFVRSAFNGRTKKFITKLKSYCNRYLSQGNKIVLEETQVWKNYVAACKSQKRRNIAIICATLATVIGISLGIFFYLNAIDDSTVQFLIEPNASVTIIYGEELDLSEFKVTYKKNSGKQVTEDVKVSMSSGYDLQKVDVQQTIVLEFHGVRREIPLMIKNATLDAPVLSQVGSLVKWEPVTNATGYQVYINSDVVRATLGENQREYDLSTVDLSGELEVSVRATTSSDRFTNSQKSEPITINKLQAPKNIRYEDGVLSWDAVEGVDKYILKIDNNPPEDLNQNSKAVTLSTGDNIIELHAQSNTVTVVEGITIKTLNYLAPVTDLTFTDSRIEWQDDSTVGVYAVYVDGEYWKDFGANYINLVGDSDKFIQTYGKARHEIGIVRKGGENTAPSEKKTFIVDVYNDVTSDGNYINWTTSLGAGASYTVKVNGTEFSTAGVTSLAITSATWQQGGNTVEIRASLGGETIIMKSVTVTKLTAPAISVSGGDWEVEQNANNRFKVGNGDWEEELPPISELSAGAYTVRVKRLRSGADALEIESDEKTISIEKLNKPVISVFNDEVRCNSNWFDAAVHEITVYRADAVDGQYRIVNSLSEIGTVGTHYLKASVSGKSGGDTVIIPSDMSDAIEVEKRRAPTISYTETDTQIKITSADKNNVKFYYMKDGVEVELAGGLIAELPKGSFEVYARALGSNNQLSSENSNSVSVFTMSVDLTVEKNGTHTLNLIFNGFGDGELKFSYNIKLYTASGGTLKATLTSSADVVATKTSRQHEYSTSCRPTLQSLSGIGYVEVEVTIKSGNASQTISYSGQLY